MTRALLSFAASALRVHRLRSALSVLGIAIGIASVILLTSIGEGTRAYMLAQFTQFGTNLLAIHPGKTKTVGLPGMLGGTTRPLTLADAQALQHLPGVTTVMPLAIGTARVEAHGRGRSVYIYGVTPSVTEMWRMRVRMGSFWPKTDAHRGSPVVVLGPKLGREIFADANPLGGFVRIGGSRFQVVGVMEPKGRFLGFDIDDATYIPIATAMKLFNLGEVTEIDVAYANAAEAARVEGDIRRVLMRRHGGYEDFTITSQAAMLEVFGNVMNVITISVSVIAGISLLVGAIGILTMLWIGVGERTGEIGLVRALGATRRQLLVLFLAEATILGACGGAAGLGGGLALCGLLRALVPGLPVQTPAVLVVLATAVSLATGLLAGVAPAQRAARMEPAEALRAE